MKTNGGIEKEGSCCIAFLLVISIGFMASLLTSGCSEAVVRQYTELGTWGSSGSTSTVLSGAPAEDQAAYDASGEQLSEADWKILETIAPRPIWERIGELRDKNKESQKELAKEQPTTQPTVARTPTPMPLANIPITPLANNKIRIYYPLQHYGGSNAQSSLDGGVERRHINVTPVDMGPIVNIVNNELEGRGSCQPLPTENALVITCDKDAQNDIMQLLADVDRKPQQVEITARIFEVQHDFDFQLGAQTLLNHMAKDNSQSLASTFDTRAFLNSMVSPLPYQGSAMKLMQTFGNSGVKIEATIQALADTGLIKEVASPRMTVIAGRTGYVLAGQELPISSARLSNDNLITEKTTYKPVGVQLYITPQTIGTDQVKLHVLTVVSAVSGFKSRMSMDDSQITSPMTNPVFDSREAETSVTVPDGNTLVIGGLRMVRNITRERKIPGLGDIPGIEWLFKNHRSQRSMNDLYFFVTPRIVHSN